MKKLFVFTFCVALLSSSLSAKTNPTGLPLPRFASLRAAEVNLRTGPGTHYPTSWVVKRRSLPVKVIAEHGNWRKVQLHDETIGWVFQSMLTGNKTVLVKKEKIQLRTKPHKNSMILAHLHQNVVGQLNQCKEDWCKARFDNYTGYIPQSALWGAEFEKK